MAWVSPSSRSEDRREIAEKGKEPHMTTQNVLALVLGGGRGPRVGAAQKPPGETRGAPRVRKQLFEIQVTGATEVLILAGDHLYRMDYDEMVRNHRDVGADVTVGVRPVRRQDASRFGILRQEGENRITEFVEKPKTEEALKGFALEGEEELYPGSMGIYLFRTEALIDLLNSALDDSGRDVIPAAIQSHKVYACSFGGYWADIGTMRAFYEANLLLTQPDSPFRFHDPVRPIYTHPRFLPGSRIYDVRLDRVVFADGGVVEGGALQHAALG